MREVTGPPHAPASKVTQSACTCSTSDVGSKARGAGEVTHGWGQALDPWVLLLLPRAGCRTPVSWMQQRFLVASPKSLPRGEGCPWVTSPHRCPGLDELAGVGRGGQRGFKPPALLQERVFLGARAARGAVKVSSVWVGLHVQESVLWEEEQLAARQGRAGLGTQELLLQPRRLVQGEGWGQGGCSSLSGPAPGLVQAPAGSGGCAGLAEQLIAFSFCNRAFPTAGELLPAASTVPAGGLRSITSLQLLAPGRVPSPCQTPGAARTLPALGTVRLSRDPGILLQVRGAAPVLSGEDLAPLGCGGTWAGCSLVPGCVVSVGWVGAAAAGRGCVVLGWELRACGLVSGLCTVVGIGAELTSVPRQALAGLVEAESGWGV